MPSEMLHTMRVVALIPFLQRIKRPLQRLLDHAKANIDVIDFRNPQKEVSWTFLSAIDA